MCIMYYLAIIKKASISLKSFKPGSYSTARALGSKLPYRTIRFPTLRLCYPISDRAILYTAIHTIYHVS